MEQQQLLPALRSPASRCIYISKDTRVELGLRLLPDLIIKKELGSGWQVSLPLCLSA